MEPSSHQKAIVETALAKGSTMLAKIEEIASHPPSNPRKIVTRDRLVLHGWVIHESTEGLIGWNLEKILEDIADHLDHAPEWYTANRRAVYVGCPGGTMIHYTNLFYDDGTVFAINNQKEPAATGRPPFWSDVVWAMAQHFGFSVTQVWRCAIANDDTYEVVEKAVGSSVSRLFRFPQEEQAVALLGTPNGLGVGWLVADHLDTHPDRRLRDVLAVFHRNTCNQYLRFRFSDHKVPSQDASPRLATTPMEQHCLDTN
ncbi:hypothetical protein GQ53DRAFT_769868 [Thozetella sp. PMI_491]|nr:hypothetical protein GQ53DRAFT_769868 [Thozetella sp. PMI_491]